MPGEIRNGHTNAIAKGGSDAMTWCLLPGSAGNQSPRLPCADVVLHTLRSFASPLPAAPSGPPERSQAPGRGPAGTHRAYSVFLVSRPQLGPPRWPVRHLPSSSSYSGSAALPKGGPCDSAGVSSSRASRPCPGLSVSWRQDFTADAASFLSGVSAAAPPVLDDVSTMFRSAVTAVSSPRCVWSGQR